MKTLLRAYIPLVIQGNSNCTGLNLISITTSLNKRISLVQREETSKTNAANIRKITDPRLSCDIVGTRTTEYVRGRKLKRSGVS